MRPLPHRSYTITRLIELGKNVQDSSNLLLRVMPEAIAGKFSATAVVPARFPVLELFGLWLLPRQCSSFSQR